MIKDAIEHAGAVTVDYERQLKEQAKLFEQLEKSFERHRQSRYKLPTQKPPKGRKKAVRKRVVMGDSHGAHIDPDACRAFLSDLERISPDEIVLLGDHLDCGGWLSVHDTMGFVAEDDISFEEDVDAANQLLDAIQERAPRARIWYIEGNHELRIAKTILKMCKRKAVDARFLLRLWGCRRLLELEKRGIEFVRRDTTYGLALRGAIELDGWVYWHGKHGGKTAADRSLAAVKQSVCVGHCHRHLVATQQTGREQTIFGYSFGALCRMQPLYADTNTTDWAHGYGYQLVEGGAVSSTWPVKITDGQSKLAQIAGTL